MGANPLRLRNCSHWPAKFDGEVVRLRIGQHALDLRAPDLRATYSWVARVDERIVGRRAPQEEGHARGQFQFTDAIRLHPASPFAGIFLRAIDELRIGQHHLQGALDAVFKVAIVATSLI